MARTSVSDLRGQWVAYLTAARAVGFNTDGWTMQEGSGSQGVSYTAQRADSRPVPGAIHDGMHYAHLGMTRGDAYLALRHMTAVLEAIAE